MLVEPPSPKCPAHLQQTKKGQKKATNVASPDPDSTPTKKKVKKTAKAQAAITPAVVPTVELSSPDNGELSEEDPEITALEVKLRAMREAHCTKDTSGRSTGAEIVFHDDIFTPDINSYGLADVEMSDNIVLHDATATTKISPAVKQKAATEAVKKEKVKHAKDISSAHMNLTMKKPLGKWSGHFTPAVAAHTQTITVTTQDEDETDHNSDEETEDIKPTAGSLARSSSAIITFSAVKLEEEGKKGKGNSHPGLRDLPLEIGPSVKDTMKPELIKWILTSKAPWDNLPLSIFQQTYNQSFPNYPAMLDLKDPLCSSLFGRLLSFHNKIKDAAKTTTKTHIEAITQGA